MKPEVSLFSIANKSLKVIAVSNNRKRAISVQLFKEFLTG